MLLIRRSRRASNAVHTISPDGELFVTSVVLCMLFSAFGDAIDINIAGEAGFEVMLFDVGGELSLLAMSQWNLLQLLLAGALVTAGVWFVTVTGRIALKALRPGPNRAVEKVPIRF